jgi:hypothetical protein
MAGAGREFRRGRASATGALVRVRRREQVAERAEVDVEVLIRKTESILKFRQAILQAQQG